MAQFGPPSVAGSINEGVEAITGGIRDYRTGEALANLPRTPDGSIDYRAAATAMYRTNPALAQQFLKMEELKGLQDYRNRSLGIQQQHVDIAKDKSSTNVYEGKAVTTGPDGRIVRVIDIETGEDITGTWGRKGPAQAPQAAAAPPPEAIDYLKQNPGTASTFERHYKLPPGSAQQYLGGGGAAVAPAPAAAAPAPPPAGVPAPLPPAPPGTSYSDRKAFKTEQLKQRANINDAELKKADDAIQSSRNTLITIGEMQKLSETAFDKPGAGIRGTIAGITGIGGKQAGIDTLVLQNKITGGALEQLRATFGGNPTEGERAILLQVQGSVSQPKGVRDQIFKDAADLVRRRIKFNQKYANAQRQGLYMNPEFTDNTPVD